MVVTAAPDVMNFRAALVEEVLAFWERSVDRDNGGYLVDIDRAGAIVGRGEKHIITQARQLYSFALGYRVGGRAVHLESARQGFDFLREHFYDDRHGGWFRATTRAGEPTDRRKNPYGIVFAVYALAEYYQASTDEVALRLAAETYDLYDRHAWDHESGGIFFDLAEDWSVIDSSKSAGHMLHAMEATSAMLAATGDQRYLGDLTRLCDTFVQRTFDPQTGSWLEAFDAHWRPQLDRTRGLIVYGHLIEAAAFLSSIAAFTGNESHLRASRDLLGYTLRHAWDPTHGGFYFFGRPGGGPVDTDKMWWVQSEGLSALSMAYRLTGDELYLDWLRDQAEFIRRYQRDPDNGEWHMLLYADGTVRDGRKGRASPEDVPAKGAYHVVQGLHHANRNLDIVSTRGVTRPGESGAAWADFAL
jgi:mannobiose 2-epimerase